MTRARTSEARIDLIGCPAFLRHVHGRFHCEVWLSRSAAERYDPERVFELHLDRTPMLVAPDLVEVDDYYTSGGSTTLGPGWPDPAMGDGAGHATQGAVFLAERIWNKARDAGLLDEEDTAGETFRRQVRLYVDRPAGAEEPALRRYYGYLARVRHIEGELGLFEVLPPTAEPTGVGRQIWVDLADRTQCDDLERDHARRGTAVALFLAWPFATQHNLPGIKFPRGLGGDFVLASG